MTETNVQTCPLCNNTVKEVKAWTYCAREDKPICLAHCFNECDYLDNSSSVVRCTYKKGQRKNTLPLP